MSVQVERWIFNVDEYHRMSEAGILSEDDRIELIEGEIVKMSPIGSRHIGCVNRLNTILNRTAGQLAIISVQNPILLDDYSEPEPDIALLKHRPDFYSQSLATVEDVLLIIEVADTSVEYDRNVKLPLYAKAGIPETWLANLPEDRVEAHSQPINGIYEKVRVAKRGECLSPEAIPNLVLSVEDILG
jgi:Uma2 family endonuclease